MACSEYEGLGISTLTSSGPWWSPGSKGLPWPAVLLALPFTLRSCHQHKVVFFFLLRISFLPEGSPSMHVARLPPGWNQVFKASRDQETFWCWAWQCARWRPDHALCMWAVHSDRAVSVRARPSFGRAAHVGTGCASTPPPPPPPDTHNVSSYLPLVREKIQK